MNKTKCEIWQLLDSRQLGGIESHVLELSHGLQQSGWPVKVMFLTDFGPHPLKEKLDKLHIQWSCLDGKLSSLWQEISSNKPSIIHTHGYKAGWFGRACGRLQNVEIVSTFHAGEKCKGKLALYTLLDRISAPLSQPIAVSDQIAKDLPSKTVKINNFVSIPHKQETIYRGQVGFVGRLSEEKGPDLFCQIAKTQPTLQFHIYGDGPMRAELEQKFAKYVTFHGQVDMHKHWHMIDLLCMPSRFEGLPMAALEAMARSIPVLASDVGALPKLIDDHQNGWIIASADVSRFSAIIDNWRQMDQRIRRVYGCEARKTVQSLYSPEAIIPQIEKIYMAAGE